HPAIVVHEAHRRFAPGGLPRATVLQEGDEDVMAFFEDVGLHLENGADLALDRVPAPVDGRRDVLDDDRTAKITSHHGLRAKSPTASKSFWLARFRIHRLASRQAGPSPLGSLGSHYHRATRYGFSPSNAAPTASSAPSVAAASAPRVAATKLAVRPR